MKKATSWRLIIIFIFSNAAICISLVSINLYLKRIKTDLYPKADLKEYFHRMKTE